MRSILLVALLLAISVTSAKATNFWLSPSNTSSAPPANASEIPVLTNSGTVYVWARPDPGKSLANWDLNIHTSTPGVISFNAVDVLNPLFGFLLLPGPDYPIKRYQVVNEPAPAGDGQSINGFQGLCCSSPDIRIAGVGIGPDLTDGTDPYYDAVNDSWLMAEITYEAIGTGMTDLFLQIGANGLNNSGETYLEFDQTDAIFGALTDPPLNGVTGRNQDSATPEARIGVPEPSTVLLGMVGLLALVVLRLRKSQASGR